MNKYCWWQIFHPKRSYSALTVTISFGFHHMAFHEKVNWVMVGEFSKFRDFS